jgi:hypothetical protein
MATLKIQGIGMSQARASQRAPERLSLAGFRRFGGGVREPPALAVAASVRARGGAEKPGYIARRRGGATTARAEVEFGDA